MSGIQYVTNESGKKTAVLIDLKKYAEVWEDFFDHMTSMSRLNEPRESLAKVKARLKKLGKLK
jgi:DNA phosphorothioation-dependent restriction protein DptG